MDSRERYEATKEERKHRAQESAPMPWWWLGQRDPIARLTGWLVAWTALLFLATILSAMILWITDWTLRDTLEANNRAWIGVINAELDNTPAAGLPILGHLTYKNFGQSPALKMNYTMFLQQLPITDKERGVKTPTDDICSMVPPGTLTVFLGNDHAAIFPNSEETTADAKVLNGDAILYWRGCFQYETYRKLRHTKFCYYLRHGETQWYWQDCGADAN